MRAFSFGSSFLLRVRVGVFRRCNAPSGPDPFQVTNRESTTCITTYNRSLSSSVETLFEYERDRLHDDAHKVEKETALNKALSQLEIAGDFDRASRLSLSRFFISRYTQVVSTGSLKLDWSLGVGGLPKGRIVEIYGNEASGKTTLALHIIKEAQKRGGCCAYFDVENAIDPSLLDSMGVDTEKLLFARPDCAENTLSVVDTLAKSGAVDVIVVDSVAALVPQCELGNTFPVADECKQSGLMTQAIRKIHSSLIQSQTLVIFVNQVRSNIGSTLGHGRKGEVTCGGNALKFYAAVRLRTRRCCLLQNNKEVSGISISVDIMKNKLASVMLNSLSPTVRNARLDIEFGKGIRREAEVLQLALDYGYVIKERNGFLIEGSFLHSQAEAEQYLSEHVQIMDKLTMRLSNKQ